MSLVKIFLKLIRSMKWFILKQFASIIVENWYGGFWKFRSLIKSEKYSRTKEYIYNSFLEHYGAWIGLGAEFEDVPILPHGFSGIFISNSAHIGKNVVIFHQVTIGSNMIKNSRNNGAPIIADNVYIGCGAKIIGNVQVGRNARIGANCVVVKNVPPNSVTVIRGVESILKNYELDNEWIKNEFKNLKA